MTDEKVLKFQARTKKKRARTLSAEQLEEYPNFGRMIDVRNAQLHFYGRVAQHADASRDAADLLIYEKVDGVLKPALALRIGSAQLASFACYCNNFLSQLAEMRKEAESQLPDAMK